MEQAWAHSPQQVLDHFQVNPSLGLAESQVIKHRELYGRNGQSPSLHPRRNANVSFQNYQKIRQLPSGN